MKEIKCPTCGNTKRENTYIDITKNVVVVSNHYFDLDNDTYVYDSDLEYYDNCDGEIKEAIIYCSECNYPIYKFDENEFDNIYIDYIN